MTVSLEDIKQNVTNKKQLHLAKAEIYPQIQKMVDASLELRGISMATAGKHNCSESELWRWVISQVID